MSDAASIIGALSTTGLESYEISQGAPVNISSVDGVGEVSVGNPISGLLTGSTGFIVVLGVIIALIVWASRAGRRR